MEIDITRLLWLYLFYALVSNFCDVSAIYVRFIYFHIPSKTSRSVSSVPWITPEIRRKIRRKNITHAKAKKTGSAKIRSKFENLKRKIKADIRKQHDLYVNNLVGDVKAYPMDFIGISIVRGKIPKAFPL